MAITLAGTAGYVSVKGLLKVFTGAGTAGLIFFIGIEVAKVVATSAIHTYGKKIGWFYNILLSLGILIAMAITSMGIYGFLSSTYKESYSKMQNVDAQVELLEKKRGSYEDQLSIITEEKKSINTTITELTKGLSNNVIQYRDSQSGEIITTTSSSTRRVLEGQLDSAVKRQTEINAKSDSLNTILFGLENQILETKLGNESASELGTLKYLADITNTSMDTVMSWFILLLIVIGDPMAVLMVIVFNKVINRNDTNKPKHVTNKQEDSIDDYFDMDKYINKPSVDVDPEINDSNVEPKVGEETPDLDSVWVGESKSDVVDDAIEDIEPMVDDEIVDEEIVDNSLEEQIEENKGVVNKLSREPIVPRGKILKEDVIKNNRGFSVEIPEPDTDKKSNKYLFNRKRPGEL